MGHYRNISDYIFNSLLICIGLWFIFSIGYFVVGVSELGVFDREYSLSELQRNFKLNETEIIDVKRYFDSIVPEDKEVEIEFKDLNTVVHFSIHKAGTPSSEPVGFTHRNRALQVDINLVDSLTKVLGWTRQTIDDLKKKLDKANCVLIKSGEPTKVGFKRRGMGVYYLNLFNMPVPASFKSLYNDGCKYILVNETLAIEYADGVIGAQCFPYKL